MNATAAPTFDRRRGFLVEGEVPSPAREVDGMVRERWVAILAAATHGLPPEEIAAGLEGGFSSLVSEVVADESEREELDALVDLLLVVQEQA